MPKMNLPVEPSSTDVERSAYERLGNASWRSGPTSVMFMPGVLGNVAGGSPVPMGGVGAPGPGASMTGGGPIGWGTGTWIGIGKVSGGGLNSPADPKGVSPEGPGRGDPGRCRHRRRIVRELQGGLGAGVLHPGQ